MLVFVKIPKLSYTCICDCDGHTWGILKFDLIIDEMVTMNEDLSRYGCIGEVKPQHHFIRCAL